MYLKNVLQFFSKKKGRTSGLPGAVYDVRQQFNILCPHTPASVSCKGYSKKYSAISSVSDSNMVAAPTNSASFAKLHMWWL